MGPKSLYYGDNGATVRRRVGRERNRCESGIPGRHPIGRWRKLPAGGGNFWDRAKQNIFRNPGAARAQPGMGLQTATRLSSLAGDHGNPGTETPAIGPKSLYCGDNGATVRRREERERG